MAITKPLLFLALALALGGCASVEPAPEDLSRLGRFEIMPASTAMRAVTLGVPHADRTPIAVAVARAAHSSFGAGLVIAHGYVSHDLVVNSPVEGKTWQYLQLAHTARARAVYREYVRSLRTAAGGALGLHVDLREVDSGSEPQVVPVGLSPEEALRIRSIKLGSVAPRVAPMDSMGYDAWIVRHDGVLLIAPRGLAIRLPRGGASAQETARWLRSVIAAAGPSAPEALGRPEVLDRGRFTATRRSSRLVVAAPHGSGDSFTDEVAGRIAERLGANLMVAHGFMGTRERRFADRITVNRPLEGAGHHRTDYHTADAEVVYGRYTEHVKGLTAWPPAVYIEIHCNDDARSRGTMEVATVGVSPAAAQRLKEAFVAAAARAGRRDVGIKVEPLETIVHDAGGNKQVGIMGKLPVSLHFEFPALLAILKGADRQVFTEAVAEALERTLPLILEGR